MEAATTGVRAWLQARRALAFELLPLGVSGGILIALAPTAEASVLDARLLYLVSLGLFSAALIGMVHRALEILEFACPRCEENFCGASPLRTRCAHCGFRPSGEDPPDAERPGAP
jgi:hypothetical protein